MVGLGEGFQRSIFSDRISAIDRGRRAALAMDMAWLGFGCHLGSGSVQVQVHVQLGVLL